MKSAADIRCFPFTEFEGWGRCAEAVKSLIALHGSRRVLEIGAGVSPALDKAFCAEAGVEFTASDASQAELAQAGGRAGLTLLDAAHWYATLGSLPFLANRLLPEPVSTLLLRHLAPRDEEQHGKLPAPYRWCQGQTPRRVKAYAALGFELLEYHGYFGHKYYKGRLPRLHRLELAKMHFLLRSPSPRLTRYAKVVLRKR